MMYTNILVMLIWMVLLIANNDYNYRNETGLVQYYTNLQLAGTEQLVYVWISSNR